MRRSVALCALAWLAGCGGNVSRARVVGDAGAQAEAERAGLDGAAPSTGPRMDAGRGLDGDVGLEASAAPDRPALAADAATTPDAAITPKTWPRPCSKVYDESTLQTVELTFTPSEWALVQSDCSKSAQVYRPVQVTYGGDTVAAMARLKGNWSWNCQKMQFIVSFNEVDSGARFHGLRKLVFDAPWYDRTLMHERIAMGFFEQRGLPHSCVNHAKLMINGTYYGLFSNVERLDKEYLERNFEDSSGNLYQGGSELKTNEDVNDQSDINALRAANNVTTLASLVDLDEAVAEWAAEAMLPALDNYWAGVEINYYLYHHPARGFLYLPYDMDITFGDGAMQNGDLLSPNAASLDPILYEHSGWKKEDLFKMVLADATWCARFVEELTLARAAYSPSALSAEVDLVNAQIRQALADDPNKTYTLAEHDASVTALKAFFASRAAFIDQWLAAGSHCPAQW